MINISDILDYWFEGINDEQVINKNQLPFKKWFSGGTQVDREIRERFEDGLARARRGEYKIWEADPRGRLALIVLFDQFSRNMFRGTPKMFETDSLALALCGEGMRQQLDQQLGLLERVFFYMPLMHSEDKDVQRISVECFERLVEEAKERRPENVSYYEWNLRYAREHFETIERFGRFPYRNQALGRNSTEEEKIFLLNRKNN